MYTLYSRYILGGFLGLLLALTACTNNTPAEDNATEKWPVNAEMKPHIQQAQERLTQFLNDQDTNFRSLAQDLEAQNTALIESCTMKGDAHDALHDWLYPHMQLLNTLSKAENYQQAASTVQSLDSSFAAYNNQFQ